MKYSEVSVKPVAIHYWKSSQHLLATAQRALLKTRQTEVARRLRVSDSTVLRRTAKYPEIMETLAASGVENFALRGEMKVPLDQYRWLLTVAIKFAESELERTNEKAPDCTNSQELSADQLN
ncbi:hypothetical protein [Candidatus Pantoea deserta]|uniref:hypothetical protein n=1 Tax=Candidatus Pantoea deserta TaxID=1869313 RepID=UPI0018F284C0|nr:hypothetical protein [Pantoea deserta]